jgi:acyl dehydratase
MAPMQPLVVHGTAGLQELIGQSLGPSSWLSVTQDLIDQFADISGDHQWIHVDPVRAARETTYGGTIAHGNFTLAMTAALRRQLIKVRGFVCGRNYGWDRVRYPAPLPSGSRIRVTAEVLTVEPVSFRWWHVVTRLSDECDGSKKPVCVGDSIERWSTDATGRPVEGETRYGKC